MKSQKFKKLLLQLIGGNNNDKDRTGTAAPRIIILAMIKNQILIHLFDVATHASEYLKQKVFKKKTNRTYYQKTACHHLRRKRKKHI